MIKHLISFRFKITYPLVLITGLFGCFSDSHFSTYAEYEATKSAYKIQIIANGTVPYGHDLSQTYRGIVLICPLHNKTASLIKLYLTEANKIEYKIPETEETGFDLWDWKTDDKNLERYLTLADYKGFDMAEVRETIRVINGAMAGPKGTVLTGQTNVLKILEVEYRYKKWDKEIQKTFNERIVGCNSLIPTPNLKGNE